MTEFEKLVRDELSGNIAKYFVTQISRFHRIQASTMFHEAAEYVRSELIKMGLKDAIIEQFTADGKTKYWTYTSPLGWEVKSAELSLIEPEERLLVKYEDVPQTLHTYSNSTPSKGVEAELVDVGAGTKPKDYAGKKVKGKLVLATGRARLVHELAVFKYGALGVITDTITYEMPNVRESLDIPDAHAYQGIWPTAQELSKVTFGFSLSKRQGNYLRSLLKGDKTVKIRAKVDARLFPGHEDVITAKIKGKSKPDEEVFLIAHLCHPKPSANDNASGSGLLLEIARTIRTLINSGKMQPPARTIRFMWVPETLGTVAYLSHHEDDASKLVAGINLDMVGQNQELCKSTLNLDRTPDSLPSYLNDYVFSQIERSVKEFDAQTAFGSSSTFRFRSNAFSGGSDHAEFTEAATRVPCVMLLQWPDLYYHTSMDTMDKVSENSLQRIGWITATSILTLANATVEDAFLFANQTASKGMARITETKTEAIDELLRRKSQYTKNEKTTLGEEFVRTASYYRDKIEHIVWREQQAIQSTKRLAGSTQLDNLLNEYCRDIAAFGIREIAKLKEALSFLAKASSLDLPTKLEETESDRELKRLVPRKLFKGTLDGNVLKKALSAKEYEWYREIEEKDRDFGKKMSEILNFMDGKRNAWDITKAVSAEYGVTKTDNVLKFLRDLEKIKLVALGKSKRQLRAG